MTRRLSQLLQVMLLTIPVPPSPARLFRVGEGPGVRVQVWSKPGTWVTHGKVSIAA
jgi:hypothetical protein